MTMPKTIKTIKTIKPTAKAVSETVPKTIPKSVVEIRLTTKPITFSGQGGNKQRLFDIHTSTRFGAWVS